MFTILWAMAKWITLVAPHKATYILPKPIALHLQQKYFITANVGKPNR